MKLPPALTEMNRSRVNRIAKALITPPFLLDPLQNVLAQTLHYLLLLAVIIAGAYAVLTSFIASEPSGAIISGSMMVISMFLLWQLHRKRIRMVSYVLVVSAYIAIMLTLFLNGGVRDEAGLVLIALLSIAGFLLGMEVVLPLGAITAVLLIIIFFAERLELIPEEEHLMPVAADELVLALIAVFVTTIILYQITRLMNRSTAQIKAQALFMQEKNEQLEATQQALIVAKEEAEQANKLRSVFFSRMSHDLRTPLSNILSTVRHLMFDAPPSEEKQEFLNAIHHNGSHLLNLINDLLDISRLEAHQLQLNAGPTALYATLSEIVLMLRVSARDKGINLRLAWDDQVPEIVEVDEQRLQQILINLIGNGIKFTDRGEVALMVAVESSDTAVAAIRFEVVDTGRGIAPEDLDTVFDPFVQVAVPADQTPGTGLGLAICRHLVEVMGGTLQVESLLGQGSRFWFTLHLPTTHLP